MLKLFIKKEESLSGAMNLTNQQSIEIEMTLKF